MSPLFRLAFLAALAACGGGKTGTKTPLPPNPSEDARLVTAGRDLLPWLPPGVDAVAELDLRRLRENQVVGTLFAAGLPAALDLGLGFDPARTLDLVVIAVYDLGGSSAATVVLARGQELDAATAAKQARSVVLDAHTLLFAPSDLGEQVLALARDGGPSMVDDVDFLRLRDAAMPARAPGGAVRLTVRLDMDARIAAAGQLALDEVPATVSLWMDVIDDLALVAHVAGDDVDMAQRFVTELGRLVEHALVRRSRVPTGGFRGEVDGVMARFTWVIGPKALARWVDDLQGMLR